jgi:hypothetical protein
MTTWQATRYCLSSLPCAAISPAFQVQPAGISFHSRVASSRAFPSAWRILVRITRPGFSLQARCQNAETRVRSRFEASKAEGTNANRRVLSMPRNCPVGSPAAAGGRCLSSDGEQSADATVADARPADLDHCRPELLVRAAGRSLRRAEVLAQVANKRNGSVRLSAASRTLLGLLAVQPNVQLPDNVLQVAQAPSI